MSSLRPVGRSAATLDKDSVSAGRFTLADGRRWPHSPLLNPPLQPILKCPPTLITLALTYLNATLTNRLTSVDSKQLTVNLNPPESTLMKNIGGGG